MKASGNLKKMRAALGEPVQYALRIGDQEIPMNDFLGQEVQFHYNGRINCVNCGNVTKKSFGQGFCYPCFMTSPANAECIVRPELCEGHLGKGRDPEWEEEHHNQPHIVYLALTDKVKVGVTRQTQVPTRWIDQGAWKTIVLAETPYRRLAGDIEVFLKDYVTDKTSWQRMLKDERDEEVDLLEEKEALLDVMDEELGQFYSDNDEITTIHYPVSEYPDKVKSLNFDKTPSLGGKLEGIRGQYLIFEGGHVINVRKFSGYWVEFVV